MNFETVRKFLDEEVEKQEPKAWVDDSKPSKPNYIVVKVTFDDGDYLVTTINATYEEAKKYYIGKTFNHGITDDRLVKATKVELMDELGSNINGK